MSVIGLWYKLSVFYNVQYRLYSVYCHVLYTMLWESIFSDIKEQELSYCWGGRPERDVVRFVKPPLCMRHDVVRFVKPPSVGGFGPPSNTWSLLSRARCVPKIIPIAQAVWPQYTNVTDGQTDRQTDFLWHRPRPNGRPKKCLKAVKATEGVLAVSFVYKRYG